MKVGPSEPPCGQGPCKVVRHAVDLLGCRRGEAAIRCRLRAVASRHRPPSRSDLGLSQVLTMHLAAGHHNRRSDRAKLTLHGPWPRTPALNPGRFKVVVSLNW